MSDYTISLNQLAAFSQATEARRKKIIRDQINPNKLKIFWYQLSKARMKKSLENKGNLDPIYDGITELLNRNAKNRRQEIDNAVSIEVLQKYTQMQLPSIFKDVSYEIIRPKVKSTYIWGVDVKVAPDIVVRAKIDGKNVMGAAKIHISKTKPFDFIQSKIVANAIALYLKEEVADKDTLVLPDFCFSIDIFGERIVAASDDEKIDRMILQLCIDVCKTWDELAIA